MVEVTLGQAQAVDLLVDCPGQFTPAGTGVIQVGLHFASPGSVPLVAGVEAQIGAVPYGIEAGKIEAGRCCRVQVVIAAGIGNPIAFNLARGHGRRQVFAACAGAWRGPVEVARLERQCAEVVAFQRHAVERRR
ncbi:hypothetical protein D3C76_1339240 [compost metagenome]